MKSSLANYVVDPNTAEVKGFKISSEITVDTPDVLRLLDDPFFYIKLA